MHQQNRSNKAPPERNDSAAPKKRSVQLRLGIVDRRTGLSEKARRIAVERGHEAKTGAYTQDFGRRLPYYDQIHEKLLKIGKPLRGKSFLHIAASTGVYTRYLQTKGMNAVAFDLHPDAAKIAAKLGNKRVVRGTARLFSELRSKHSILPFRNESFDFVLSDHFLFSNYKALDGEPTVPFQTFRSVEALQDIHRILRPGGYALLYLVIPQRLPPDALEKMGFEIEQNENVIAPDTHSKIYGYNFLILRKKAA